MPTYGHGIKGREMMRLAFGLYDMVAFDRNRGLKSQNRLPNGTAISVEECKWVVPGIKEEGLTGGAVWYDAIAQNTERLILEYVKETSRYGGCVANYTEAIALESGEETISAVKVRDLATGEEFGVDCSVVVNAAGPWINSLSDGRSELATQNRATAINIVVKKKLFKKYAVGLEGYTDFVDKDAIIKRGKRLFFFVPWKDDYTMIGTTYKPYLGDTDSFALDQKTIEEVLGEINGIYPEGNLTLDDVTFFHGGLLPMNEADESQPDSVQMDKSSRVIDHGENGGTRGLLTIKGVKYTTAPDIAQRVLKVVAKGKYLPVKEKGGYQLNASERRPDFGPLISRLGDDYAGIRTHLKKTYGPNWGEVFTYLVRNDSVEDLWVSEDSPLLVAEVPYFIHEEMAVTLSDVVFRRSGIGSAECPSLENLVHLSGIMAGELGWDSEEQNRQVEAVQQVFAPVQQLQE